MNLNHCKFCGSLLTTTFVDLGTTPLANSYLSSIPEAKVEKSYPLITYVCDQCLLVQLGHFIEPTVMFDQYAYFSSYSDSWLNHLQQYADHMISTHGMDKKWQVIEIGSNDGALLNYFNQKNIPVLGIEPAQNIAKIANDKGIKTQNSYFSKNTALSLRKKNISADLLIANNVLAHMPDLNDVFQGLEVLLSSKGIITIEVPHLYQLITNHEFDTIYHEHCYYFSLSVFKRIANFYHLKIINVQELSTHGGSLRIYLTRENNNIYPTDKNVSQLLNKEQQAGLNNIEQYKNFSAQTDIIRNNIKEFINYTREKKQSVVCYGAPAKGNTLLNFCNINNQHIDYTVDKNPYKQNHLLPGSHIPIYSPKKIFETKPNFVMILPWNIKEEIIKEFKAIGQWGGKFVVPIPDVEIIS